MKLSYGYPSFTAFLINASLPLFWTLTSNKVYAINFDQLVEKVQQDILQLRDEVEMLYQNRCNSNLATKCSASNYHDCLSESPSRTCLEDPAYTVDACAGQGGCSALWEFEHSSVSVPEESVQDKANYYIDNKKLAESVCFSQGLDDFMIDAYNKDKSFWDELNVGAPSMYFGSSTGAFRIWPGRQAFECGAFDPRVRPWYIAASSGPKNVVLVLDTSGSMGSNGVLELMKAAAKQIVNTLTVGDRVAVVEFDSSPKVIAQEGRYLFQATSENKEVVLAAIDSFRALGGTNILSAFQSAFNILEDSISAELNVPCNTAIIFLTDGDPTEPANFTKEELKQQVHDLVRPKLESLESKLGKQIHLFTYSISEAAASAHDLPKELACQASDTAVWAKIVSKTEVVESLTSYYQLFTVGLGSGRNGNFTAWVEPYEYASSGVLGTTISAPVYDRSRSPPYFLGVVGMDFPVAALEMALTEFQGTNKTSEAIKRVAEESIAYCPEIDLSTCDYEYFRQRGSTGDEGLCFNNCTAQDFAKLDEGECPTSTDYPRDVFVNRDFKGIGYVDRTCCLVGSNEPSDQCAVESSDVEKGSSGLPLGAIIGIVISGLCCVCFLLNDKKDKDNIPIVTGETIKVDQNSEPEIPVSYMVVPLPPPPQNPNYKS